MFVKGHPLHPKRPFEPETAALVLRLMSEHGMGLKGATEKVGVDRGLVRRWATENPQFAEALRIARQESYEHWADEILEIADSVRNLPDSANANAQVQAARLAVDSRKWILSKLKPDQYGDRVELTGKDGAALIPMSPEAAIPRLMQVLAVLLPGTANTELHNIAAVMAHKLNGALPAPALEPEQENNERSN